MWVCYFCVVMLFFWNCNCSEFTLERDECLLSSKNHSLIIDLYSTYTLDYINGYTLHFSLCLKRLKKCPKGSFICLENEKGEALDVGSEISGITYEGGFNLALKSNHGSGNIHIMCNEDVDSPPLFENLPEAVDSSQLFNYTIKWISRASCPLLHYKTKNSCILYTKDQSYDLRPLQYYLSDVYVEHEFKKYYISFCKGVSHKDCSESSVCESRNGTFYSIASFEDSTFQYIEKRGLSLTYKNNNAGNRTVINFICTLYSTAPVVQFVENDEEDLVFNVSTSLICPQNKMNCLIDEKVSGIDHHRVYDLTTLHLLKDNWHIGLNDRKMLVFNFCGPVNFIPHVLCSGGPYFACLLDNSNRSLAFGYDTKVNILQPGLLSMEISGKTFDNSNFSLHITLECAKHSTYPSLLKNSTVANKYTVNWKTNAACPSEISRGPELNCRVNNPYYQTMVDVSPLHKKDGDYNVIVGAESFRINICGRLNQSCSETRDASVCYKNKDGKEIPIGLVGSREPVFKDGQFLFHIEGEPCNEKVTKSKIKIILSCEYFEENNFLVQSIPEYFQKANECEFYFFWRTSIICTKSESMNCTIQAQNKIYDLSPLKNLKENYIINFNNTAEIVLNVCHSLLPGHRIQCHPSAGSCLVYDHINYITSEDYAKKKKYENLGLVSNLGTLEFIDGSVHLTYKNGAVCELGTEASLKTILIFECDETVNETLPVLVSSDECEYILKWKTNSACPINPEDATMPTPVRENKTVDIKRCALNTKKKKYDLSSLLGKDWNVENRNIILSVCSPVKSPVCLSNLNSAGACLMTEERGVESIGDYNTNLIYEDGSLYLHYNTSMNKQTKIEFVCSKAVLQPRFIGEKEINSDFITYISWPTPLVCDKEAEKVCCNQIENLCQEYDGTYHVPVSEMHSVFLSLCRPIIPGEGYLCNGSSPSCFISKSNTFIDTLSLGRVYRQPIFTKEKSIIVEYFNGSLCKPHIQYSMSIRLYCSFNKSNSLPKFVRTIDDCKYEFDWGTDLLCNHIVNDSSPSIPVIYSDDEIIVNGSYIISFCTPSPKCRSHVCKYSPSNNNWTALVGKIIKTESDDVGIRYYFTPANNTHNEKCVVVVKFIYNFTSGNKVGLPVIRKEGDCILEFNLKGNKICHLQAENVETENVNGSLTATISWSVVSFILLIIIVLLIIWFKKKRRLVESIPFIFRYKRINSSSSLIKDICDEDSIVEFEFIGVKNEDKLK